MRDMGSTHFFEEPFHPRLLPRENIQIAGEFYEVVEVRPAFFFDYKVEKITSEIELNLKDLGLKGLEDELLNLRLKIHGPVQLLIRIEGAGGPVYGGWGGAERLADERTPPNLLEFLIFGEKYGWIYCRVRPIVVPAWLKLSAYGYVYLVKKLARPPSTYTVPAYVRGGT
jgi:hypothetical protein